MTRKFTLRGMLFGPSLPSVALAGLLAGCVNNATRRESTAHGGLLPLQPQRVQPAVPTDFAEALAWFSRGLSFELEQNLPAALNAYQEAVRRDPNNITLAMLASQRLTQAGRPGDAVLLMESMLERNPQDFQALIWLARLHLQQGNEDAALALVLRATRVKPQHEGPWLEASRLHLRAGREDEALDIVTQSVAQAENPSRSARILCELWIRRMQRETNPEAKTLKRDEARDKLNEMRLRFPNEAVIAYLTAALEAESGNRGNIFPVLRDLDAAHAPDSPLRSQIFVQLARILRGPTPAMTLLRSVLATTPDDVLALYLSGMFQELAQRPDLALDFYLRAVAAVPGDLPSHRKVAVLYYQLGQARRATRSLDAVLSQRPDDPELLLLAGHLNLAVENYREASGIFQRLELMMRQGTTLENPAHVHTGLAMAHFSLDNTREVVDALYLLGTSDPSALESVWRHQLRHALSAEKNPDEKDRRERFLLEALLDLSDRLPELPEVEHLIAKTYSFRREYPEALSALGRMAEIANDQDKPETWLDTHYYFDVGAALERCGRIEESYLAFERSLALNPENDQALNYLAYMWAERGIRLDEALAHVQLALKIDPVNGSYLDTLGWIQFQMGNFEDAYTNLRKATEYEPAESVIVEHIGDAALKLNRPVEAAGYYRIALDLGAADRVEAVRESLRRAEDAVAESILQNASAL